MLERINWLKDSRSIVPLQLLERPIAHRGLHNGAAVPENSMRAFDAAVKVGAPIELDVRILRDGTLVVFHDAKLQRLTGRSGSITSYDRQKVETLRLLDTDQTVPLFADVLDLVGGAVTLLIEVKSALSNVGRLESAVVAALKNYAGEYAIQSFNPLSLKWLRRHAPDICRGQLSGGSAGLPMAHHTIPDFAAYNVDSLPTSTITQVRSLGLKVLAWTVQHASQQAIAIRETDNYIFDNMGSSGPYRGANADSIIRESSVDVATES